MPEPREISITAHDHYPLAGELVAPGEMEASDAGTPLVVLQQGSTHCNRDGDTPRNGFRSSLYKRVARMLQQRGIASFRYDKRQWDWEAPKPLTYSMRDRVEDLKSAFRALLADTGRASDSVQLIGHSEGGVIAQIAACELGEEGLAPMRVCVLASPAVSLLDSIAWRVMLVASQAGEKHQASAGKMGAILAELRWRAISGEDFTPKAFEEFKATHQEGLAIQGWESWAWMKEHAITQARVYTPHLPCPALFIHGDHDRTVSERNLELYREASVGLRTDHRFESLPQLGHFLEDSTRKAFVVSEALFDRVALWVKTGN